MMINFTLEGLHDLYEGYYNKSWIEKFWDGYKGYILSFGIMVVLSVALLLFVSRRGIATSAKSAKTKRANKKYNRLTRTVDVVGYGEVRVYAGETYSPPIPSKNGYIFGGWFVDSALTVSWLSTQKVKCDMTLYPKWTKE